MSGAAVRGRLDALVDDAPVGLLVAAVAAELALLVGYFGLTSAEPTAVRYLLYPFVWLNLGLWAVFAVDPPDAGPWARRAAAVAAVGYFLALGAAGGLFDLTHFGHGHTHGAPGGLAVFTAMPPGWAPTVVYETAAATVTLVPYKLVGYVALTYLAYVAVLETLTAALSGAVGLLSCVSCSWPVFASLLAGAVGGSTAVSAVYALSLDISTVAFVVAVALLVWRPGSR